MDAAEPLRLSSVVDDAPGETVPRSMWHITLTVAGQTVPEQVIKSALERLSEEHPFLLSGRYAADRAEVRYWEEAVDVATALRMAVLLWDEHTVTAQLPMWRVVGVECVDRETFHRRGRNVHEQPGLVAAGRVIPF
ncbi:MAG: hypothetical protein WCP95_10315 [Actinomycetes bacterium]